MASEKSDSERCFGGGWLDVFDAVAENQAARERFDALDLGRDKKSFLSWRIRRCNFYQRTQLVLLEAVEANAAFRNIFSHSTTSSACAWWRTHALKLTRMRTWRRLLTGRPLAPSSRTVRAEDTAADGVACDGAIGDAFGAAAVSGAGSTAEALAPTGET